MGNLTHISFNRAVTDDQFTAMLKGIIEENYGDYYVVEYHSSNDPETTCWKVKVRIDCLSDKDFSMSSRDEAASWYSLFFRRSVNYNRRDGTGNFPLHKGKFGHSHMRVGYWGYWFTDQLHGHFSKKYGTRSTDDGVPGSWQIDPTENPTYKEYLTNKINYKKRFTGEKLVEALQREISELPVKLRSLSD